MNRLRGVLECLIAFMTPARRRAALGDWMLEVSVLLSVFPTLEYLLTRSWDRNAIWWVPVAGLGIAVLSGIFGLYLKGKE